MDMMVGSTKTAARKTSLNLSNARGQSNAYIAIVQIPHFSYTLIPHFPNLLFFITWTFKERSC
jgi:hypothetical protein